MRLARRVGSWRSVTCHLEWRLLVDYITVECGSFVHTFRRTRGRLHFILFCTHAPLSEATLLSAALWAASVHPRSRSSCFILFRISPWLTETLKTPHPPPPFDAWEFDLHRRLVLAAPSAGV